MQASREQQAIRDWLTQILSARQWTPNRLAHEAGIAASTIHRAMTDDRFTTSTRTLSKIAKAAGAPMPGEPRPDEGFAEEGQAVIASEAPRELVPTAPHQSVHRIATRALELAGVLPGDLVLIDTSVTPRRGDILCLQHYDFQRSGAVTAWRQFEPPYAIARTMSAHVDHQPILIDNERARIVAPVTHLLRLRGDQQ